MCVSLDHVVMTVSSSTVWYVAIMFTRDIRTPYVGEKLFLEQERGNRHDFYATTVEKDGLVAVYHGNSLEVCEAA